MKLNEDCDPVITVERVKNWFNKKGAACSKQAGTARPDTRFTTAQTEQLEDWYHQVSSSDPC